MATPIGNKTALIEFLLDVFPETFSDRVQTSSGEQQVEGGITLQKGNRGGNSSYNIMMETLMEGGEWTQVWDVDRTFDFPYRVDWDDGDIFFIKRGAYSYFVRMIELGGKITTAYIMKKAGEGSVGNIDTHYLRDDPVRETAVQGIVNDYGLEGNKGKIWMYSPSVSSKGMALNYSLKGWSDSISASGPS